VKLSEIPNNFDVANVQLSLRYRGKNYLFWVWVGTRENFIVLVALCECFK